MKSIAILLLLILFSVHVAGQDTTNINKVQQTDIADSLEILNKWHSNAISQRTTPTLSK